MPKVGPKAGSKVEPKVGVKGGVESRAFMRTCPKCERTYPDDTDFCPLDSSFLDIAAKPTDAELAGSLTRRYKIIRRLGEGGMGTVFLAEQIAVGNRPVALKVLLRKLLDDPEFLERFRNEAASTGRIRHPNVVTVYESGQSDDGTPYIAMEYLEGQTLSQALKSRGALPVRECATILDQAARGLHAAHKLGIIHRDLKPDNIFLTRNDEGEVLVKVVDFGIAKLLDATGHSTLTGIVLGTPAYMSAEHAAGMRGEELDPRSDVYSLGVVTYEMLTGRTPFQADTPLGYVRKHVLEPPPALNAVRADLHLSPQIEQVILKALDKVRERRYDSTVEFAREFAAATHPAPAAPAPAPVVPSREGQSALRPSQRPTRDGPAPASAPKPAPTPTVARADVMPTSTPTPARQVAPQIGPPPATPRTPLPAPPPATRTPTGVTPRRVRPQPRVSPLSTVVIVAGLALVIVAAGLWFHAPRAPEGMVYIPGGTFAMGCTPDQDLSGSPPHYVTVAPFYLDQVPTTNAQYRDFVRTTRYAAPAGWTQGNFPPSGDYWPVTGVSWAGAAAYAKWKGKRLPTEAEWEFAARGTDGRLYPWGSNFNSSLTNSLETELGHPEPVGRHLQAASPFGVLDMSGNVWEWCEDNYKLYPGSKMKSDGIPPDAKVIRGGSFDSDRNHVTTVTRNLDLPTAQSSRIGFRCARSH